MMNGSPLDMHIVSVLLEGEKKVDSVSQAVAIPFITIENHIHAS